MAYLTLFLLFLHLWFITDQASAYYGIFHYSLLFSPVILSPEPMLTALHLQILILVRLLALFTFIYKSSSYSWSPVFLLP